MEQPGGLEASEHRKEVGRPAGRQPEVSQHKQDEILEDALEISQSDPGFYRCINGGPKK